jgi:hypothetical protein
MAGVHDVQIAGDESDAVGRATCDPQGMTVLGLELGPVIQFGT